MSATEPDSNTTLESGAGRPRVGRRRQYEDEEERELIFQAAYGILRDSGAGDVTLARILDSAGLSTRSFYRHFPSKDALLCAMYRRDAEWAGRRIAEAVAAAGTALDAVEVWIGEIFRIVGDQRRAERAAVLGSLLAARADGIEVESAHGEELLVEPLRSAIEDGVEAGVFDATSPAGAADLVAAMVMHGAGLEPVPRGRISHDVDEVRRYALRTLGAT